MISLSTARKLKQAGLDWQPKLNDFFAIPERDLDERVFVIADMLSTIELLQDNQVVSFQGASEWALDSLVLSEVVWMPSEEQLRLALEEALLKRKRFGLRLVANLGGYRCEVPGDQEWQDFEASSAEEAYAAALLSLLV